MKQIRLGKPAHLDQLHVVSAEPRPPGPGEVLMRVFASSLNYHDYVVVTGGIPTADGRVPMSDGAGEVVEVGPAVETPAMQAPLAVGVPVLGVRGSS